MNGFRDKKIYLGFALVFFVIAALTPLLGLWDRPSSPSPSDSSASLPERTDDGERFRLRHVDTGKIETVSRQTYLFGVLAAEMGGGFEPEALKAQAVAAYSFALYRAGERAEEAYDLTDDPSCDQAYLSRQAAQKKWGDSYDSYAAAIDKAVKEVDGYCLVDEEGQPILAAYHAVSSGRTESSLIAWGTEKSYLQPVESVGDLLSPDYLSTRTFTDAELAEKLKPAVTLTGDALNWLGEVVCSPSGTVTAITLGGTTLTGEQVRQLLALRSAAFQVVREESGYTFQVKGYGHGVGMSQYGANYMAKCGSTFVEILSHYYTGCKMVRG